MKNITNSILEEVSEAVTRSLQTFPADAIADEVQKADRIFFSGDGRSGLAAKMAAMRMMHLGYEVYVTGETTTPSISENDLLMVLSGSGETKKLTANAEVSRKAGASVVSFTTNTNSSLAQKSDIVVKIAASTKYRKPDEPDTIQPLGNQFDQSLHLLLDAFIIYLNEQLNHQSYEELKSRHANLE
jgi:6-phospho-3-hexuloisomerase